MPTDTLDKFNLRRVGETTDPLARFGLRRLDPSTMTTEQQVGQLKAQYRSGASGNARAASSSASPEDARLADPSYVAGAMPDVYFRSDTAAGAVANPFIELREKYKNLGRGLKGDILADEAVRAEFENYRKAATGSWREQMELEAEARRAGRGDFARKLLDRLNTDPGMSMDEPFQPGMTWGQAIRQDMGLVNGQYPPDFRPFVASRAAARKVVEAANEYATIVDRAPEAKGLLAKTAGFFGNLGAFALEMEAMGGRRVPFAVKAGTSAGTGAVAYGGDAHQAFFEAAQIGVVGADAARYGKLKEAGAMAGTTLAHGGSIGDAATMAAYALVGAPGRTLGEARNLGEVALGNFARKYERPLKAAARKYGTERSDPLVDVIEKWANASEAGESVSRAMMPGVGSQVERNAIAAEASRAYRYRADDMARREAVLADAAEAVRVGKTTQPEQVELGPGTFNEAPAERADPVDPGAPKASRAEPSLSVMPEGRTTKADYSVGVTAAAGLKAPDLSRIGAPIRRAIKGFPAWYNRWFRWGRNVGRPVVSRISEGMRHAIAAEMVDVDAKSRVLVNAIRDQMGVKGKLDEATARQLNDVLQGLPARGVPSEVRDALLDMRGHVDALTRVMVSEGLVGNKLAATLRGNEGVYLNRAYRIFDDPNWKEKVDPNAVDAFRRITASQNPRWSANEVEAVVQELLDAGANAESAIEFASRTESVLGILKPRKDIMGALRKMWGEYEDPVTNYTRTIEKQARFIERMRAFRDIRAMGAGRFVWDANDPNRPVDATATLGSKEPKRVEVAMGELNGMRTTQAFKRDFMDIIARPVDGPGWLNLYLAANAWSKVAKTGLSHASIMRNFVAGHSYALANAHWNLSGGLPAMRAVLFDLGFGDPAKLAPILKKHVALGNWDASVTAREVTDLFNDAGVWEARDAHQLAQRVSKAAIESRTGKALITLFRAGDSFWKVIGYESELARYKKAYPGKSEAEVSKIAQDIVNRTYANYNRIPKAIKGLRYFPVAGTFVSFPYASTMAGLSTIRLAAQEIANPATRSIGLQRAAGIVLAAAEAPAIATASQYFSNIDDEQDGALRRFVPEWMRNGTLFHTGRDGKGRYRMFDLSYTDYYSYLRDPVMAMLRGDDWEGRVGGAFGEMMAPFAGEEMLFKATREALEGKLTNGAPIWNEQAPLQDKITAGVAHIYKAMEPGSQTSVTRLWKAFTGHVEPWGKTYSKRDEAIANLGFRAYGIDVPTSMGNNAKRYFSEMRDAHNLLDRVISGRGTVGDDDIRKAYQDMEAARRNIWANAMADVDAAIKLGMTRRQVFNALDHGGFSKDDAHKIMRGEYKPWKPAKRSTYLKNVSLIEGGATREDIEARKKLVYEQYHEALNGATP